MVLVKLAEDYDRDSRTVDLTKVTKDEYVEVDGEVNSVQNLIEADILVEKKEEDTGTGSDSDSSDEVFECEECGDEFDSKRGLTAHKGQVH